jgi:hypothetical protein
LNVQRRMDKFKRWFRTVIPGFYAKTMYSSYA